MCSTNARILLFRPKNSATDANQEKLAFDLTKKGPERNELTSETMPTNFTLMPPLKCRKESLCQNYFRVKGMKICKCCIFKQTTETRKKEMTIIYAKKKYQIRMFCPKQKLNASPIIACYVHLVCIVGKRRARQKKWL